jgi:hypothetical protein
LDISFYLSSDSITAWNIYKLHSSLVLDGEGEPVVIHGGVGLPGLAGDQLTKDGSFPAVTDSGNEDV